MLDLKAFFDLNREQTADVAALATMPSNEFPFAEREAMQTESREAERRLAPVGHEREAGSIPSVETCVADVEPIPFGSDGWPIDTIAQPAPCPTCIGSEWWQDLMGGWHCERCEPRTRATQLLEHVQRLRERYAAGNRPHGLPQDRRGRATMTRRT